MLLILKIVSASLLKADEKAKQSLDTSDMDTDKEAKKKRKFRARKDVSSSESEKESSTEDDLPPPPNPPKKRKYKKIYYVYSTYIHIYTISYFIIFKFILYFERCTAVRRKRTRKFIHHAF